MTNPELQLITKNGEYRKIYKKIISIRSRITAENKKLLNEGKRHKYQCNCNVLRGMSLAIERLPKT